MKKQFTFLIFIFSSICSAQNCIDWKLSKTFDFDIMAKSDDPSSLSKTRIVVKVFNKIKKIQLQTIVIESESILTSKSYPCVNNNSYATDTFLKSVDNDFGDVIVVDFNFDGKEDVALKREEGGNGGPLYNFYIQSENEQFILDKYLSDEVAYFPYYIDSKEKTLSVRSRINSVSNEEIKYLYNDRKQTWIRL
ncbi:hypothetical protein HYN48_13955 [Flavobacterium magnum]|uniref:VCBS repeat-containing protein n=1 Tax=Flavobacterium magnum TaxID=2162713 RepID=A0A2S0RH77_9FLAO|nr:hypothetical protein [Flavobacterium magnum]AWA31103.1 hypothetical protein HYN48_13955 [Flavobacterium magnum]